MKLKIIAFLFLATTAFTAACSTTHNGTSNYENILDHSIDDEYLLT